MNGNFKRDAIASTLHYIYLSYFFFLTEIFSITYSNISFTSKLYRKLFQVRQRAMWEVGPYFVNRPPNEAPKIRGSNSPGSVCFYAS